MDASLYFATAYVALLVWGLCDEWKLVRRQKRHERRIKVLRRRAGYSR